MPPLHGAFPLPEINDVPVGIAEDLHLDVPGPFQIFLNVNTLITKGVERLGSRIAPGGGQFIRARHHAHAFAASSGNGFQQYGVADFARNAARCLEL